MQSTLETPHFWQWIASQLSTGLVGFLGALGALWLKSRFEKRKDEAELDLTDSQANLNRAQKRKAEVDAAAEVMTLLDKAVLRSAEMNEKYESAKRGEKAAKDENKELKTELKRVRADLELCKEFLPPELARKLKNGGRSSLNK